MALPAWSATTTISDTVRDSSGTGVGGTVRIINEAFTTAEGTFIGASDRRITLTAGVFSELLEANDNATPSGTSYEVRFAMDDGRSWVEYWVVPTMPSGTCAASPTSCTIGEVRVVTIPTPGVVFLVTQLSGAGFTNGQQITWNGTLARFEAGAAGGSGSGIDCPTSPTELTISSGGVTLSGSACYTVDTEADAPTDDLTSITCAAGDRFIFRPAADSRSVVVKHDGSAIRILADFTMNSQDDSFYGWCRTTNTVVAVSRNSNGN